MNVTKQEFPSSAQAIVWLQKQGYRICDDALFRKPGMIGAVIGINVPGKVQVQTFADIN